MNCGMLTLIAVLSVALTPSYGQGANSCLATLSTDMNIHVPSVRFAEAFRLVRPGGPPSDKGSYVDPIYPEYLLI